MEMFEADPSAGWDGQWTQGTTRGGVAVWWRRVDVDQVAHVVTVGPIPAGGPRYWVRVGPVPVKPTILPSLLGRVHGFGRYLGTVDDVDAGRDLADERTA